jgi:hypothetical protein
MIVIIGNALWFSACRWLRTLAKGSRVRNRCRRVADDGWASVAGQVAAQHKLIATFRVALVRRVARQSTVWYPPLLAVMRQPIDSLQLAAP